MSKHRKGRASMDLTPKEIAALLQASRITEEEIQHWHSDFLHQNPSGELDKKTFIDYYKKLHPQHELSTSFDQIFDTIDVNRDGLIDFNEFLVVVVLMDRLNDLGSRLSFVFDMWDQSGDEQIDQKELANVISAIYDRAGVIDRKGERDPKRRAKDIIAKLDLSGDKKLSKDEFITGCKTDPVIRNLLAPNF
ncbi:unnamed protein product [Adineta ricciae]|uniref:EF-hand domain-containing protein n=1 Tax=Adineta ricciae TaxID=249248 RepID=A0A814ULD0_ADIRI|nr:unnamed protein product [Adineta ricciae]CAF1176219.1 unnamed protein product [Adineta ricciae]